MKKLSVVFLFAACSSLSTSQQQLAQSLVNTGVNAGVGYLTGGTVGAIAAAAPSAVQDVQEAAVVLRQAEQPALPKVAPSASQISSILGAALVNPSVIKAIGPKVAGPIASAVASGLPASSAVESVAVGLDKSAAAAVAASPAKQYAAR